MLIYRSFSKHDKINFEQFLNYLGDEMKRKRGMEKMDIQYESEAVDVNCFLCPGGGHK